MLQYSTSILKLNFKPLFHSISYRTYKNLRTFYQTICLVIHIEIDQHRRLSQTKIILATFAQTPPLCIFTEFFCKPPGQWCKSVFTRSFNEDVPFYWRTDIFTVAQTKVKTVLNERPHCFRRK